jgi:Ca-activated chloride channel family protein
MIQALTYFHWLRPWWLLALLPLLVLFVVFYRRTRNPEDWRQICDAGLLPHVLIGQPGTAARYPAWLLLTCGILVILALAGPVWERLPAPVFRNVSALVIVLDLSIAMDAADLKPNRLERARFKIADILRERKDGQTALLVYGGDAFTVTPLTDDTATIESQLAALSTALMPVQGSRIDLGLQAAARLLKQAGLKVGDLLLVTSGTGAKQAEGTVRQIRAEGYRLSVLGVGTEQGAPVPLPEGGFLKDERGGILLPRLDSSHLRNLASTGGGLYRNLTADSGDIDVLLRFLDQSINPDQGGGRAMNIDQWQERGPWLLLLVLPLAALSFRRGWLGIWLLMLTLPLPDSANALEWRDLWITQDQQAQRDFAAGQSEQAAERFQNPEWKATAEYKAGRYGDAAEILKNLSTPRSQYNLGNALAQQGRYQEALSAYDQALAMDPDHADARYNRDLVQKALEKQQEQNQSQQSPKDQSESSSKDNAQTGDQNESGQPSQPEPSESEATNSSPKEQQDASASHESENRAQETADPQHQPASPEETEPSNHAAKPQAAQEAQAQPEQKGDQQSVESSLPESRSVQELRQAEEQWLRRIPDDPGGLLKRKFYYQYRQRQSAQESE